MSTKNSIKRLSTVLNEAQEGSMSFRGSPKSVKRGKKFDILQKKYIDELDSLLSALKSYAINYYLPRARRAFYEVDGDKALSQIFQIVHRTDDYCEHIKQATNDFHKEVVRLMDRFGYIDDLNDDESGYIDYSLD